MKGRPEAEIQRNIIKMSLENDGEGFIYFNDLLYKSMRLVYGEEHVRNRLLGLAEKWAMVKIKKIKKTMAKRFKQSEKWEYSIANPFLAMLYYNKAFKAWKGRWHKNRDWRYNEKKY